MSTSDFITSVLVNQTPAEVFDAINNVRGWWSEEIEGSTEKLNDEFSYHYEDVHACKMKLIEVIPNKSIVWQVLDNYFNFTHDQSEWKGTKVIFEIFQVDKQTQLRFTHQGLVPAYECYEICREAWTNYIKHSLYNLITTGKGQPNPKEGRNEFQEDVSKRMNEQDFHYIIMTKTTADEVFRCINNVAGWWTENMEGSSQELYDEFTVRFGDVHYSRQKLTEVIPGKKVVWLVTDSRLSWLSNKQEWTNTRIVFEISEHGDQTQIDFTHIGLSPEVECFEDCSSGWNYYLQSLTSLINTGKGTPESKVESISETVKNDMVNAG